MRLALLVVAVALLAPATAQAAHRDFRSPSGRLAKVLRYGRSTTFGRLKCISRRRGITCRSLAGGHGFRVSVEQRERF